MSFNQQFCNQSITLILNALKEDETHYFIRVVLNVIERCIEKSYKINNDINEHFYKHYKKIQNAIIDFKNTSQNVCARRYAAQTLEFLWIMKDPKRIKIKSQLNTIIDNLPVGSPRRFKYKDIFPLDKITIGRILAAICADKMPLDITIRNKHVKICKGSTYQRRMWRILYEFMHPRPDKRQGTLHTVGRTSRGNMRIASNVMYEVSPTAVPGEPLLMEEERGWRPYLPLADDFIPPASGLASKNTTYFSVEGQTKIKYPMNLLRRAINFFKISISFNTISQLRTWKHTDTQKDPAAYINYFRKLKYVVDFEPNEYKDAPSVRDSTIQRFFKAPAILWAPHLWNDLKQYYFSIYGNTQTELVIFIMLFLAFLLFNHGRHLLKIRKIRNKIPLSIGGWGTRGKSGVERLKSALFYSLSFRLSCKTTGSESILLTTTPMKHLLELPIYRPYDKATIWEQANTLALVEKLHDDIFLWECMAVKPSYTEQLQAQWMRDDIATITNTFPDHENQQGPAGHNVAEVIAEFIPPNAKLVTAEVQLLPILRNKAKKLNTEFYHVDWEQGDTLPPKIISELPYTENVANINLLLKLSNILEIPSEFVYKAIKDHLVADVGSFKIFPKLNVFNRQLSFINSMSANDYYSTVNNLNRIDFFNNTIEAHPENWTILVVNNRFDRLSRTERFTEMQTNDVMSDQVIVVGSNLPGYKSYIKSHWKKRCRSLSLWDALKKSPQDAVHALRKLSSWLRIPTTEKALLSRLNVALNANEKNINHATKLLITNLENSIYNFDNRAIQITKQQLRQHQQFVEAVLLCQDVDIPFLTKKKKLMALLSEWFYSRFTYVKNKHITGNGLNKVICGLSLPNLHTQIIAIQNIKGPGLNLLYSWEIWLQCHQLSKLLNSHNKNDVNFALQTLSHIKEFSSITIDYMNKAITDFRDKHTSLSYIQKQQLIQISLTLEKSLPISRKSFILSFFENRAVQLFIGLIENLLEPGDSIRRRKRADQIYRDLTNTRISYKRAAEEIKALQIRQKGGWLIQSILSFLTK